ncbi:UNVERIFIED_CONTAM: hypothetical protein GTU68_044153, partial [Idotea baltica]|nr:hypothetical protein [Idotea baltica]
VYETYGTLNSNATNAVLVCHALSGQDARPGWWDACIGPGKAVDTNKFFVVSLNNLGGCHGSSGPRSIDPETGQAYGPNFPTVTVEDWVASQLLLADHLGIQRFAAVIGGSLGGMQALRWAIDYSDRVHAVAVIASAARLSAQNIAFNEIARQAITKDPAYAKGDNPEQGLALARMLGHVTYLSADGMKTKFGRELKSGDLSELQDVEFQVESYLRHQGKSFSQRFDANTYLLMTYALDYFDPAKDYNDSLVDALASTTSKFFVASFSSDWRFAPARSQELVDALVQAGKPVACAHIESEHGHDSFLLPIERYLRTFGAYMNQLHDEVNHAP